MLVRANAVSKYNLQHGRCKLEATNLVQYHTSDDDNLKQTDSNDRIYFIPDSFQVQIFFLEGTMLHHTMSDSSYSCPNVHDRRPKDSGWNPRPSKSWAPTWRAVFEAMWYTTTKPGIATCKLQHGVHLGSLIYFCNCVRFHKMHCSIFLRWRLCVWAIVKKMV